MILERRKVEGFGLMRIFVGMNRLVSEDKITPSGRGSFSRVIIGVTAPKVRTRVKGVLWSLRL